MELISIILDENRRIKKLLENMDEIQKAQYKLAYADAMEYASKLEAYKRLQGQKYTNIIKQNKR